MRPHTKSSRHLSHYVNHGEGLGRVGERIGEGVGRVGGGSKKGWGGQQGMSLKEKRRVCLHALKIATLQHASTTKHCFI